ncbi:MAG TPA: ComEC/Rec2 family competence protein [Alphaproteobacteria bacterium]|nr:ComEC/Rec2 family competence protein [Alphaproteobacteria bacterium]
MFIVSPIFLAIGIAIYHWLSFEPAYWVYIALAVIVVIFIILLGKIRKNQKAFLSINLIINGFLLAKLQVILIDTTMLQKPLEGINVIGQITKIELMDQGIKRIILRDVQIEPPFNHIILDGLQITVRSKKTNINLFDRIKLRVSLFPPATPVFPDGYNFYRGLWFQGISAIGFSSSTPQIVVHTKTEIYEVFEYYLQSTREQLTNKINAVMSKDQAAIARALILGDQHAVSDKIVQDMRDSGLAHLLSVSGLHLSLICLLTFAFSRRLLIFYPLNKIPLSPKKVAAILAIIVAFIYLFLTNAAIPTQRSFIMMTLLMIGILIDRHVFGFTTLAWAAIVILVFQPFTLLTASFQMSFVAVATIIAINNRSYQNQQRLLIQRLKKTSYVRQIINYITQLMVVSFWVGIAITPITLYHFQQTSLYAVLANMVAIPITSFIVMPAALIAVCLSTIGLQDIFFVIMGIGIEAILYIAHWVSLLPASSIIIDNVHIISVFLSVAAVFIWLIAYIPYRRLLSVLTLVVVLCISWFFPRKTPDILVALKEKQIAISDDNKGYYIIVGQKDSFLMEIMSKRLKETRIIPLSFLNRNPAFTCDWYHCTYELNNKKIAIIYRSAEIDWLCDQVEVVIDLTARLPTMCPNTNVVLINEANAQPFYWGWDYGDRFYFLSTQDIIGQRPWSLEYTK